MRSLFVRRFFVLAALWALCLSIAPVHRPVAAQSRRQPPTVPQKKNQRPGEGQKPEDQQEQLPPDIVNKPQDAEIVKVASNLVNVEVTVVNKKTKQLVTGLTKANFAIFEDGVKQEITNFGTPEAKMNIAVVMEFSKLSQVFGLAQSSGGFDDGRREVILPAALFMRDAVSRGDYVSVVAYDMRATPLTDFTNDPSRINAVINLLSRNWPAFREANLFDALKLTLVGGKADSVVLEDSKQSTTDYSGLVSVEGRRRAILLISSGLDTFSKINYDQARKITQNAGIPIYIIGTGNMFMKKYSEQLGAVDGIDGFPGRLTLQQAQNTLTTFAKETGGAFFPYTFEGELPSTLSAINALMRNQYSLGYNPGDKRDGKQHKIIVKVDADGDGVYEEGIYDIQHRRYYNAPKPDGK